MSQARTESGRHEARRVAATDKLTAAGAANADAGTVAELAAQALALTRRAAVMDAQVDILDGKRRTLGRFRDAVVGYSESVGGTGGPPAAGPAADGAAATATSAAEADASGGAPPALSRVVLGAQEDLRREIARAMHDGPAQSLTNIVLQAQIVERLVGGEAVAAREEVRQLVEMVEHTLEATKSFIFDVRPMVLDDLGLVPTLRRAARDRGRRAGVPVEFESLGVDRRLPMELESSVFRILDEALAGYLGAGPLRVSLMLDWSDSLVAEMTAVGPVAALAPDSAIPAPAPEKGRELPPALAAMVEDQRATEAAAAEVARRAAVISLPAATWRDIGGRASTLNISVELHDEGSRLRLEAALPGETPANAS